MTYGIDPGKSGAIVMLTRDAQLKAVDPMPQDDVSLGNYLSMIVDDSRVADVWIERVPKYAGKNQSGSAVATLFANYRYIVGYLEGRGVMVNQVVPQSWMKPYRLLTRTGRCSRILSAKKRCTSIRWLNFLQRRKKFLVGLQMQL